jgi:hypothetical protein
MVDVIASESRDVAEYARRADAYAFGAARPPSERQLVLAFASADDPPSIVRLALRRARAERENNQRALFGLLVTNINEEE